ncbi:hypothetical protein DPMN_072343 [Dreissena polymorpha]|uniref:Uncharacterized protein n=1 Tax=Dreissena polymorpha TaxID=45954 RepID=A0A9D4BWT1_DREPO|nr:hypothetical protein DPMN_072343 [Dreissena polymorpha]
MATRSPFGTLANLSIMATSFIAFNDHWTKCVFNCLHGFPNAKRIIYKLSRDIIKNDDCLLAPSNNCLTSLKLTYPTAAMFLKGHGPFVNYADISFEKKVLCKSHNDCAKHQTSRVCYPPPADSHVFNKQKSFPNPLLIYHKNTCSGYAS